MTPQKLDYRLITLDNGFTAAVWETDTMTTTAQLEIFHGSCNEQPGEEGYAHFLEHIMMSGGSQDFPRERIKKLDKKEIPGINALTGLDKIAIPADFLGRYLPTYLEFASELALKPAISEETLERERTIVFRELSQKQSSPDYIHRISTNSATFGERAPWTYEGLGTQRSIIEATREGITDFHRRGFTPDNMRLLIAGSIPTNIDELIEQRFGWLTPREGQGRFQFPEYKGIAKAGLLHLNAPELMNKSSPEHSRAEIYVNIAGPTPFTDDSVKVQLMTETLGQGVDSILFKKIREEMGLAYQVAAGHDSSLNKGLIWVKAIVDCRRIGEAVKGIFESFREMHDAPLDLDETAELREYYQAKHFETNPGRMSMMITHLEEGKTPEDYIRAITSVTPEDIQAMAQKYLPRDIHDQRYVVLIRDPLSGRK